MSIENKIKVFNQLGTYLLSYPQELLDVIEIASFKNKWFTKENIVESINSIAHHYLSADYLIKWVKPYIDRINHSNKVVGVVAAGNIPLVVFHDVLSVLISGHTIKIKLSEKDDVLLKFVLNKLIDLDSSFDSSIQFIERLKDFDAVIATGSNNSARYFEHYFANIPNVIRKNRNSIAVLTGNETEKELTDLGKDVFSYFGLGCRNVSKLMVPIDYDFQPMADAFKKYEYIADHNKYKNNFDYNRTLLLMNKIPYFNIDFINLVENESITSAIATLHYEYYESLNQVFSSLEESKDQIQCVVGKVKSDHLRFIPFGESTAT